MIRSMSVSMSLALAFLTGSLTGTPSVAQQPTTAEKLYSELAKIPPPEREKRLIEGAKKEGRINLISSLRGKLGRDHIKLFRDRYPFLKVEMSELGSQDAAERLFAEEAAGRHLTDVIGLAVPDMAELIDKNIAAKYPTPAADRILPQYRKFIDPQNRWLTWSQSEHGIVYNSKLVTDPPKTWFEMCDPRFKGKMSFDPLETRLLVGLYYVFGEDISKVDAWLQCIAKNDPIVQRGHTARLRLMLSGDHSISPDQYLYQGTQMKHKSDQVPFAGNYLTEVMVYGQAHTINKNTPHPHASALFTDWALSDESQNYMAKAYRGPVAAKHPYFPDNVKLVPFNFLEKDKVDKLHDLWSKHLGKR